MRREAMVLSKDAVRKVDAPFFSDPKRKLIWEPVDANAYAGGKTGLTTGRYKMLSEGEKAIASGAYVTGWRKEASGQWKVIFDTGVPDQSGAKKQP